MTRCDLLNELWNQQDIAFDITTEYDSIPHKYGSLVLYQAEAYMLDIIGLHPGITTTELADAFGKTVSACSQLIKKLVQKNLAVQTRNETNKRIFNITLTPLGTEIFKTHVSMTESCKKATFDLLQSFTDDQLETAIQIQALLNQAYRNDLQMAKEDILRGSDQFL